MIGSITQRVLDLTEVNGAEMSNFGEIFKNELTKISYVMLAFGSILIIAEIVLLVVFIILDIKDFKNTNKKHDFTFKDWINSYAEVMSPISVVNKKQSKDNNGYIYTLKYKVRLNNKVNDDTWYEGQSDVQLFDKVNV